MDFHIIYRKADGELVAENHTFEDFNAAEKWLESINAQFWEIGIRDEDVALVKFGSDNG